MNVGTVCQRLPVTIGRTDEVTRAAKIMREKHIGYLIVAEPHPVEGCLRVVGVLTDRDIVVTVVAREIDPSALRVGEIMTPNPLTIADTASTAQALQELRRAGVRRMPVVGLRGELVGVVSLDDLISVVADEARDVANAIRNERQVEGTLRP